MVEDDLIRLQVVRMAAVRLPTRGPRRDDEGRDARPVLLKVGAVVVGRRKLPRRNLSPETRNQKEIKAAVEKRVPMRLVDGVLLPVN